MWCHYTSSHKKELKKLKEKNSSFLKGRKEEKWGEKGERRKEETLFFCITAWLIPDRGIKNFSKNLFLERKDSAGGGVGRCISVWSRVLKHHNSVRFTYKVHIYSSLPSNCSDIPRTITDGYILILKLIICLIFAWNQHCGLILPCSCDKWREQESHLFCFFMKSKIKHDLVNEGQFFNWLLKD